MSAPRDIVLQWQPSSYYGWGVYGLNLALHWVADPALRPLCSAPADPARLALDPLRRLRLGPFLAASSAFQDSLAPHAGTRVPVRAAVLSALAADFTPLPSAHGVDLAGSPDLAAVFFESAEIPPDAVERARRYRTVVAGSRWNRAVLDAHGIGGPTVLQGVDDTLFHPAPVNRPFADRFLVFSGGKAEYRKGQDLVMLAFRAFASRHPEALLVTAWHSPWPETAASLGANPGLVPPGFDGHGRMDVRRWAAENGVDPDRIIDLGQVPNAEMPPLLREMDAAVFPNRCEGGTNLVAMECMACGVPTILADNTGQRDLVEPGACLPLTRQTSVPGRPGWGESEVEEIVEALEALHRDRAAARVMGARGAAVLARLSWRAQAAALRDALLPLL
ncbi:glycosyltransferase family 4 protein [Arenibaculum pallidiluteum]|uniref:glycosyltransferase family 4 protein n=1 Tax=Arenibaculum pallidiluteum TaxID=2812559 RepID=UPI001A956AB8|nr:glycosyltransferase family 4 protein [Arenibaculum pallidiluteum]